MAVNKITLMAIKLVLANCIFTTVNANDNPNVLQECFQAMEICCLVKKPTALDCARAAVLFWKTELHHIDMQEYYEALYKTLNISPFDTPTDFCHRKRNRQQCRDELKDYFMNSESGSRVKKMDQQKHAVRHAFFYDVLSCSCEGSGVQETMIDKSNNGNMLLRECSHSYKDTYILIIHKNVGVKDSMDSPFDFCRIKHEPGYKKQPYGVDQSFNLFKPEEDSNGLEQCLMAMESYCDAEDPSPLDCAQAAILNWSTPHSHYDVQEYYEALYDNLDISDVQTPIKFCHNRKDKPNKILQPNQLPKRLQCKHDLGEYNLPKRSSKEELQTHAVYHAFFNTVFSCDCKGSKTLTSLSHRKFKHSYKDKYILSIRDNIKVKTDTNSPEQYCREKYVPGYKKQV